MTDVLIVGGGPAGSSAALRLARAGYDVAVLERAKFPRTKVCGEYLSPGACAVLADLGLIDAVSREAHPLRRVVLGGFDSEPVILRLPPGGALSLPRSRLDELLLDAARARGARIVAGVFLSFDDVDGRVDVRYRDADGVERTHAARLLIGADGAWSAVAQRAGLSTRRNGTGRWAVGGHLRGQEDGDALEMYVGPGGYYARNPLGNGRANSMLVLPQASVGVEAERAVDAITNGRRGFESASLEKQVAVGPLRYRPRGIAAGRVLLAGDAAGLLDPFVGQGISIALESSTHVTAAVEGLARGERQASVARRFSAARSAAVRPRTVLAAAVDIVIRTKILRERARRAISRNPSPAEEVLAAVSGARPPASALSARILMEFFA